MPGFLELVLTVCTLSQPVSCDDRKIVFDGEGASAKNCVMNAMPMIARWSGEHPGVEVTRWRCNRVGDGRQGI